MSGSEIQPWPCVWPSEHERPQGCTPAPLSPDRKTLWHIPACYRHPQHVTVAPTAGKKILLRFCPTPTTPSPLNSALTKHLHTSPSPIHWGRHLFIFIMSPVMAALWSANTAWAGTPVVPRCWVKPFPLGLISYPTQPRFCWDWTSKPDSMLSVQMSQVGLLRIIDGWIKALSWDEEDICPRLIHMRLPLEIIYLCGFQISVHKKLLFTFFLVRVIHCNCF